MERMIDESVTVEVELTTVREALAGDPVTLFGVAAPDGDRARVATRRRAVADVGVPVGGGASARQAVVVEIDSADDERGPVISWRLWWHPTAHTRVVPSFSGELRAVAMGDRTRLSLRGTYHPPLGALGIAGDAVLGRRVAKASALALLTGVAERLAVEARRHPSYPADHLPSNFVLADPWPV